VWRVSALDRDGREVARMDLTTPLGELTIGRDQDRQLVLPSASVSRRHARIVVQEGRPCIIDEGSANGVLINGVRISGPTAIGPSTRIDVAEFRISIESLSQAGPMPQPLGGAPVPRPQGSSGLRLIAEGGPYDGREFNLPPGGLKVGRATDNELVLDDPSLSRHHAQINRPGGGKLEVEDLGSSNGTFVNGRRIGKSPVAPGDTVRFGDLSFRLEGGEPGSTRSVEPGLSKQQLYLLMGSAGATFLIVVLAIAFLIRKVPPVQASGKDAIARLQRQADGHFKIGKQLYAERKWGEAKTELDQAVELDPANVEARKLQSLAAHGTEDDRLAKAADAQLAIGDKKGLENALRLSQEISDGSPGRAALASKLGPALSRFGTEQCTRRAYADCAWALCRAFEVAPADARPSAAVARTMRDAEKKLKHDRSFSPCKATAQ
jgi:pSer/pThr/pTyr-binding forkhead associated (FHA) protein